MQAFTLAAITDAEKNKLRHNKNSAEVDIAPASGKIHITMQGFTLTAITDAEKTKLRLKN